MANKIFQPEQITILRSQINFAAYNPRIITEEARKMLKANMKKVGLLGGVVWNRRTGNLVAGHQRVAIMDAVNRYDHDTGKNDYEFRVEEVDFDEKTEKEQNLFMNNKNAQGQYDEDLLRSMLKEIDYTAAGFDDVDLQMMGLSDFGDYEIDLDDPNTDSSASPASDWSKGDVIGENEDLASHDSQSMEGDENTRIDRSTGFYDDTQANQIARHNEVQKIKDRIAKQNDENKDGGALSYVVVSFATPSDKELFLADYGFDPSAKYVNGQQLRDHIEFGIPEEEESQE